MAVGLFSVMCLFGVGVLLGIFHVGQPLRALNMLLRVGHSPMSNEIMLSALFAIPVAWAPWVAPQSWRDCTM
jgi:anaerobic dimethyl sulfoxide reductase subunit C (anchor subunit)